MNSWDKSDTDFSVLRDDGVPYIGPADLELMHRLADAGSDHRKYMRQIFVSMDVTAPLYWWKEYDTYKVGTVANSCSTMHKIHAKEFELSDFSCDKLLNVDCDLFEVETDNGLFKRTVQPMDFFCNYIIPVLNACRERFLETKDHDDWYQMIQLLPSSYNQLRTLTLNYEVLRNIYHARKNHKLDEWHRFCDWIGELPYSEIITGGR